MVKLCVSLHSVEHLDPMFCAAKLGKRVSARACVNLMMSLVRAQQGEQGDSDYHLKQASYSVAY